MMIQHRPDIETLTISEARGRFSSLVNRVSRKDTRVLVEKGGIPVAAIVSAEDLKRLDQLERERSRDFAIIDELRAAFRGVSNEEIERETDRAIAEIRAAEAAGRR